MRPLSIRRALLLVLALVLAACHGRDDPAQPGGRTPEAAVQSSIELLKSNDLKGWWKHALPPAEYARMRADWIRHQQQRPPLTAQDRARFARLLQQLTEPGAENKLYATLQPKLSRMQQQYSDQLPILISVGEAFLKNGLAQNAQLTAEQKAQAAGVLDALLPWAKQAAWFDQTKARQAIDVIVATTRKLPAKSLDQLRAMDFDASMDTYAGALAGARQLLAIYGLSVDDVLKSVRLTPVSLSPGHAVVKIDYTLLGKPLSTESRLVEVDGRWYSQDVLENVQNAHRQLEQAPVGAASTGIPGTAAAPTASAGAQAGTGHPLH